MNARNGKTGDRVGFLVGLDVGFLVGLSVGILGGVQKLCCRT